MSIPVALDDLAAAITAPGTGERPYLLTAGDTHPKAVHVAPALAADGTLLLPSPGGGSLRNAAVRPGVTLVWPPSAAPGFSLVVDGTARAVGDDLVVEPVSAVLHKPVVTDEASATHPFWVSAFLDVAPAHWSRVPAFWAAVSGSTLSTPRGDADEFTTLVPPGGHDHLRAQRVATGPDDAPTRLHLDLHVPDPGRAARRAAEIGARVVHRSEHGYVVLESPGGFPFCLVAHPAALRTPPVTWPGGGRSLVDQVCLDAPAALHDAEVAFWSGLTGWRPRTSDVPGFTALHRPAGQPVRLLVQAVGDDRPRVTAHLDVACDDREAEVARHVALGAEVRDRQQWWTVLADPSGAPYCVVDRTP
ncbi:VOC family protein [Nocardioides sp. CPCC 205120]|uniref:VOC family protein n=1 Tax=Nocardioides sp. CPCC 205120 TaxID=3406462 RepID=UPI003B50D776